MYIALHKLDNEIEYNIRKLKLLKFIDFQMQKEKEFEFWRKSSLFLNWLKVKEALKFKTSMMSHHEKNNYVFVFVL